MSLFKLVCYIPADGATSATTYNLRHLLKSWRPVGVHFEGGYTVTDVHGEYCAISMTGVTSDEVFWPKYMRRWKKRLKEDYPELDMFVFLTKLSSTDGHSVTTVQHSDDIEPALHTAVITDHYESVIKSATDAINAIQNKADAK